MSRKGHFNWLKTWLALAIRVITAFFIIANLLRDSVSTTMLSEVFYAIHFIVTVKMPFCLGE
jgi:hypothetical protein